MTMWYFQFISSFRSNFDFMTNELNKNHNQIIIVSPKRLQDKTLKDILTSAFIGIIDLPIIFILSILPIGDYL